MKQPAPLSQDSLYQACACFTGFVLFCDTGGAVAALQNVPLEPQHAWSCLVGSAHSPVHQRHFADRGCLGREDRQVLGTEAASLPENSTSPKGTKAKVGQSYTMFLLVLSPPCFPFLLLEAVRLSPHHKVLNDAPSACCQLGCQLHSTVWCPCLYACLHHPD